MEDGGADVPRGDGEVGVCFDLCPREVPAVMEAGMEAGMAAGMAAMMAAGMGVEMGAETEKCGREGVWEKYMD